MKVSVKKIKRVLFAAMWIAVAGGVAVLLIAAMRIRDNKVCSGLGITIKDVGNNQFADKNDVAGMIKHMEPNYKGKSIKDFDLQRMEKELEGNLWIKDAELYFDNKEVLRVVIRERVPMARVFTTVGKSFYIDSDYVRLPLSPKFSAKVPVFTNCTLDRAKWNAQDSLLLQQVKSISSFLSSDKFWMAEVEQVDYNTEKQFELFVKTGSHKVVLGDGNNLENKFKKLLTFYQEVLNHVGWNAYTTVNVQYKGQVVATRKEGMPSIQSLNNQTLLDTTSIY